MEARRIRSLLGVGLMLMIYRRSQETICEFVSMLWLRFADNSSLNMFFSGMRLFGQEFHVPRFMAR